MRRAWPLDDVDVVLPHQETNALCLAVDDLQRAPDCRAVVHLQIVKGETELLGVLQGVQHFGALDERLFGDAAPVQADAAKMFAFDEGSFQIQLRGANRRHITARPGADDDQIIVIVACHKFLR